MRKIFLIRYLMENYREACIVLHIVFIDLKKAYEIERLCDFFFLWGGVVWGV